MTIYAKLVVKMIFVKHVPIIATTFMVLVLKNVHLNIEIIRTFV